MVKQYGYLQLVGKKLNCFLIITFMLLLTSCSHVRKDGPPNFYVDETKVPDAVPKVEPLSKNGNMRYYHVFGKRYYTMRNSKNYKAVGTASWYGTKFHSRHTSSGERYDMLAMTAAHKTLPLPTYVEVTNLRNHRKVIVKVNDRGPFESNRLIDLSYVAAKKLGMLGHGTTKVQIRAIDPKTWGQLKNPIVAERERKTKQKLITAQKKTNPTRKKLVSARKHKIKQRTKLAANDFDL